MMEKMEENKREKNYTSKVTSSCRDKNSDISQRWLLIVSTGSGLVGKLHFSGQSRCTFRWTFRFVSSIAPSWWNQHYFAQGLLIAVQRLRAIVLTSYDCTFTVITIMPICLQWMILPCEIDCLKLWFIEKFLQSSYHNLNSSLPLVSIDKIIRFLRSQQEFP